MLNWINVKLIFLREVRDQLRDRRTLFMVAVLPLLLYPALGIGMMQLTVLFREQPRTVVVLGAKDLPKEPPLIEGSRFARELFSKEADPNRLVVISDAGLTTESEPTLGKDVQPADLLRQAELIRQELRRGPKKAGELFGTSKIQVLVLVPPKFRENLDRLRRGLVDRPHDAGGAETDFLRPEIVYNKADDKSQITYNRVSGVLERWEDKILDGWLTQAKLDKRITHPIVGEPVDVALEEHIAASLWSKLFPALLVIMAVTGAFYPAIDLVAGEKERGTMETLLICPATRTEIVLGKFFTVMVFSATTALLNLASMGFTGRHIATMAPSGALSGMGQVGFPPLGALAWVLILLIPLASLFSALCLALATFARSSKEGQYYLTPLLMVALGLTMFCLSPGVDLTPQYCVIPIAGIALLLKGLLLSPLNSGGLYVYIAPVLISSIAYSALALWWAIDQFNREEVLFREAERFELRLWIRHLLRDKEPTPSFTEAVFCFVLIMLLQFFATGFMQRRIALAGPGDKGGVLMQLMIIQQLAIVASPALFMGVMLTTSVRNTFRIRWPGWKFLAAAVVLPLVLHPLSVEALSRLQWFFEDLPPGAKEALAAMAADNQPLWFILLTFAFTPAFCEEVVFRGFMLSGFERQGRTWLAIGLSSVAFGLMHMIPQQVFNASLMGIVLGLIAVRSRSLIPSMAFHFLNNALGVVHGRAGITLKDTLPDNAFCSIEEGALRYHWPLLLLCAIAATLLIRWLAKPLVRREPTAIRSTSSSAGKMVSYPTA